MARTGIFGRSGAGKSWYFGWYLERAIQEFEYAIHFDPEDEERGLSLKDDPLFKTFYVDEEFANETAVVQGKELPLVSAVVLKNKRVRIVTEGLTPDEQQELFADICGLAMSLGEGGDTCHVSADEAHSFLPDIGDSLDERVVRMLTGGRKWGVEYAFCTQRPAKLHEDALTQMNFGVYFEVTKDNDVAKINNSCGFNAFQELPGLGTRVCLIENLDEGNLKKVHTEDLERQHPHVAGDDGIADDVFENTDGTDIEFSASKG